MVNVTVNDPLNGRTLQVFVNCNDSPRRMRFPCVIREQFAGLSRRMFGEYTTLPLNTLDINWGFESSKNGKSQPTKIYELNTAHVKM